MRNNFERKNKSENQAVFDFQSISIQVKVKLIQMYVEKRNAHIQIIEITQKQGDPYTKNEQDERRNKVYSMYFEKGFSAIKIANELKEIQSIKMLNFGVPV